MYRFGFPGATERKGGKEKRLDRNAVHIDRFVQALGKHVRGEAEGTLTSLDSGTLRQARRDLRRIEPDANEALTATNKMIEATFSQTERQVRRTRPASGTSLRRWAGRPFRAQAA
jgi:hypothetical protein